MTDRIFLLLFMLGGFAYGAETSGTSRHADAWDTYHYKIVESKCARVCKRVQQVYNREFSQPFTLQGVNKINEVFRSPERRVRLWHTCSDIRPSPFTVWLRYRNASRRFLIGRSQSHQVG